MNSDAKKQKVRKVLERYEKLKQDKAPFSTLYRLIGKYVMTRKQMFDGGPMQGHILTAQVFDGTAGRSLQLAASAFLGALFPNAARTFRISPPDTMPEHLRNSAEIKAFYKRCTDRMATHMDNPRAGLSTSLIEYMTDQLAFGISGIGVWGTDDKTAPVRFTAIDCKQMFISEGPDGFVDTVYLVEELTVKQLVQRFGYDVISAASRKMYDDNNYGNKICILHAIEPRIDRVPNLFGNDNKPVASIIVEIAEEHELEDSGYDSIPTLVTRFWKAMGEIYGRSPSSEAMPDILEANLFREASIVATEKMLRPPLVVNDPDILGRGKLRTGAGEINVRKMGGRQAELGNRPAVEPLVTITELQSTYKRIAELREVIEAAYFIDQLKDLGNGQTRITAEQARMLYEFRGQHLGSVYARQIAELFTPLIDRTFNILFNEGVFGIMPDSPNHYIALASQEEIDLVPDVIAEMVDRGEEVYRVDYISPARRLMQAEELAGMERFGGFLAMAQPLNPQVIDNVDFDDWIDKIRERTGSPETIIRAADEVQALREAQAQQQQQLMALQAAQAGAGAAKDAGSAVQSLAKAGQQ